MSFWAEERELIGIYLKYYLQTTEQREDKFCIFFMSLLVFISKSSLASAE